jgi:hypothetical protein
MSIYYPTYVEMNKNVFIVKQGILTEGGRLSTVDLLIKVACFVKKL